MAVYFIIIHNLIKCCSCLSSPSWNTGLHVNGQCSSHCSRDLLRQCVSLQSLTRDILKGTLQDFTRSCRVFMRVPGLPSLILITDLYIEHVNIHVYILYIYIFTCSMYRVSEVHSYIPLTALPFSSRTCTLNM